MRVVVGHANPDFDAYASTVAATKLFPGARGVYLGSQNANVRAFHNLHEDFLDFVDLRGLDLDAIDSIVIVDTRDPDRIGELGEVVRRDGVEVVVYDHHPPQEGDLAIEDDRSMDVGATTSILVHELKSRGIAIAPLEASLFLLGIHEDTGSLTYPGATAYDADAAAYLMATGADMEVLNQFLARTLDPAQQLLLSQLQATLEVWDVNGQPVAVGWAEADQYVDSASVLTHYVVEDMGYRVAIAVVRMPDRLQIVARSRLAEVDVGAVMARLGGGGHAQAASAGFRDMAVGEALVRVREALEAHVHPPLRARDVMSEHVRTVSISATMREAGELMARWGHGGLPVIEDGGLAGIVTRKDVDKAARHGLDHAPVTGFMGRDIVTVSPELDLVGLERLLATRGIGRVPVVEHGRLVGIVTRKDVLRAEHGESYLDRRMPRAHPEARTAFVAGVATLLPDAAAHALSRLGALASERGEGAHVVGGFVRDMVLGRPNLDLDVVVEGDGIAFAEDAAKTLGVRVTVHRRFGTAVLVFDRSFHIDIASSRTEYYARPGALPTVERSSLRQDLFRRDFTINAMAACVTPGCFGEIADPFGGLRDLEKRVVRVLHGLSFVEDPTRVLRAARFETRYGFHMEPATEAYARKAIEMELLGDVSGARLRQELLAMLDEAEPWRCLARLEELGALGSLLPDDSSYSDVVDAVRATEEALVYYEGLSAREPRRQAALIATMATSGSSSGCLRWIRHFRISRELAAASFALAERGQPVLTTLQDGRGMRDSRLYHLLSALPVEARVVLWTRGDSVARERLEHFERVVSRIRPAVTGRDLLELGAEPSEVFSDILSRARDDRLDGRVVGREAELANLRRLAHKAGIIGNHREHT